MISALVGYLELEQIQSGGGDPRTHKIGLPWWNSWSWIESLAGATSVVQLNQAQAGFLPEYVMLGLPCQDS